MKKVIVNFQWVLLIIFMLSGCDSTDETTSQSGNPTVIGVRGNFFSYMISDNPKDESTVSSKQLGVYLLHEETGIPVEAGNNIPYISNGDSKDFQAVGFELRTPADGSMVSLMAYAPYKENLVGTDYPLDFTLQDEPGLQLYRSTKSNVLYDDHANANIELRPVLSKALFKLIPAKGVKEGQLDNAAIRLDGMFTRASFDVLNGVMSAGSDVRPISLTCDAQNENAALLLPSNTVEGYKLTLTTPHMEQSERECLFTDLNGLTKLEPGMQYTFNITVEPDQMRICVEQTPIGNWGSDGNSQNIGQSGISENYLLTDIQDFEVKDLFATKDYKTVPAESWFYRNEESIHPTDNFAKIVMDETLNKKVVNFKMPTDANVTASNKVVGYHMTNATKGKFKVQFKAKLEPASATTEMKCYLRCGTGRHIVVLGGNAGTGGAQISKDTYSTCNISFDFTRTTANTWDNNASAVKDITDADLKDVYITFAFNHKAAEVRLYDLKLLKAE